MIHELVVQHVWDIRDNNCIVEHRLLKPEYIYINSATSVDVDCAYAELY